MFIVILRFLLGFVDFSAHGPYPLRLLNQLSARGISVWNMRREGDVVFASMKARDYKNMFSLRGKNRVFTKITARHGLPFILKKYRLRVGFALGVVLYFSMLIFLSNFVWNVEIVGIERLDRASVLAVCEDLGIKEGVKISSLDQHTLPSLIALKLDDVAWCSVNIEGVKVTVNVSESKVTEITDNTPCNLIAKCDGIVTKIEVLNGSIAVKPGQTVKKGDLLVSGFVEFKDGSSDILAAKGQIIAKTERTLTVTAPFETEQTVTAGEPVCKTVLSFFGVNVPLYLGSQHGEFSVSSTVRRYEKNGMYLPIFLKTAVFTPIETVTVTLSRAEAEQKAHEMLKALEEAELENAEIISRDVVCEVTDSGVTLNAKYICRENIAEPRFLLIY